MKRFMIVVYIGMVEKLKLSVKVIVNLKMTFEIKSDLIVKVQQMLLTNAQSILFLQTLNISQSLLKFLIH